MRLSIKTALIFSLLFSLTPLFASANTTINLNASATNTYSAFLKYLYSFPLPATSTFIGLTGSASIKSDTASFSEALISVQDIPSGPCPVNGERFVAYSAIYAKYPTMRTRALYIIKEPGAGVSTEITQLTLPQGLPVSNCLVVVLDGSILFSGGQFTMTSNMNAVISTSTPPSPTPWIMDYADEFCFGQGWGCQLADAAVSPQRSFMKVVPITSTVKLLALYGTISDSSFSKTYSFSPPPTGAWSMQNDYYVYHNCTLPAGIAGPADYYASIPAGATNLMSITMQGTGMVTLQQPVFKAFSGVTLVPGDCLVHLVKPNANGGIDAENQVVALVQASTGTPPPPPAPTATISANPTSITAGSSSTLSWSSTNATSCTGTGFTAGGTSGSVAVSPTQTATYSIACTGAGGSASANTTLAVTAAPANTSVTGEIWFGGYQYASALSAPNAPWPTGLASTSVYTITEYYINTATTSAQQAALSQFFTFLTQHHIALSVAVLMNPPSTLGTSQCGKGIEGYSANPPVELKNMALRVQQLGGVIQSVSMDEPLWFGHYAVTQKLSDGSISPGCQYSIATIAQNTALGIAAIKSVFPNVQVGDDEPVTDGNPLVSSTQLLADIEAWTAAYKGAVGQPLTFFNADISWNTSWQTMFGNLVTFLKASNIKLGIYYNAVGTAVTSNQQWTDTAISHYQYVEGTLHVIPNIINITSWQPYPTLVLPETQPGTLTYLLAQYVGWSKNRTLAKPTATLSATPASITSGSSATLSWSSTNATGCIGTGFTAGGTSGSVAVSPTQTATYSITCTGAGGSASATQTVTVTPLADTTPPVLSGAAPTGTLPAGTTSTTLKITTNENSLCAYATAAGVAYASMSPFSASTTGTLAHTVTISGLKNSTSYTYYVKCKDASGNVSGNTVISFNVATAQTNTAPKGTFDGITATPTINGWAYDPDTSAQSITVNFYIDGQAGVGQLVGSTVANTSRPDVDTAFGISGNHGFVWPMPAQYKTSTHSWYVYAVDSSGNGVTVLIAGSPKTYTVAPPVVPKPTVSLSISPATITIGAAASLSWTSTNATTCAGTNFTASATSGSLSVTPQTTTVYTLTCTGTGGSTSATATATVVAAQGQSPNGYFDVASPLSLSGWAYDPDTVTQPVTVQFYVDGPAGTGVLAGTEVASTSRPDVIKIFTGIGTNHGFVWSLPSQYRTGTHTWYVYAVDTSGNGVTFNLHGSPKSETGSTAQGVSVNDLLAALGDLLISWGF